MPRLDLAPNRLRSSVVFALVFGVVTTWISPAKAEPQALGFGVERLSPSAPGAGWFVLDSLDMHGGFGGVMGLTLGYAHNPLVIDRGGQHLAVISNQAFVDFGFALTYDRFRLYTNFDRPLVIEGKSGTALGRTFTAPGINPATPPDVLTDVRIGFDARLVGSETSPFRLGAGIQLLAPNGERENYETDGTYRVMGRVLFAGDQGLFTYAGHLGVHVRPLNDAPTPESPRGSELLFAAGGGVRLPVGGTSHVLVIGPEIFGASAFRALFGGETTALEGLLSGRLEGTASDGPQLRFKLGAGAGIDPRFGAPDFRMVFGIEVFDRGNSRHLK
ncbi:MAG: hypothetical protein FWD69_02655 [Polyangiaceae bacterium]|nr:hypothetical protein [Polyangiaceae bacterium]